MFTLSYADHHFVKEGLKNLVVLLFAPLFLIACSNTSLSEVNPTSINSPAPPAIVATQTFTAEPSETPTLTPTTTQTTSPTATQPPTLTPSPTLTKTPTETPTPTITLTPTAAYNAPGTYIIGKCVKLKVPVNFCVLSVNVLTNGSMVFNVSWENNSGNTSITKKSDVDNPNMFIEDNLGNNYHPIQVGGDAALKIKMEPKQTIYGYFTFSPAMPGATSFEFHDSDQGRIITGIVLLKKP